MAAAKSDHPRVDERDLPACDAGPAGRLRFVLAEVRDIIERLGARERGDDEERGAAEPARRRRPR